MDEVVANRPPFQVTSTLEMETAPLPISQSMPYSSGTVLPTHPNKQAASTAARPTKQPVGYDGDVSSSLDLPPGKEALFSLPANHVGEKWHFEIPFKFKVPAGHCCRTEDVGGEPEMHLTYGLWDLPPSIQTEIKKM
jgi:hypothetical protein